MIQSPSRYSQCGRILRVLEDGKWHSATEIFRNLPAGATIHSRIAELRKPKHGKWSYQIEHETRGPGATGSFYRLVLPRADAPPMQRDGVTGGPFASVPGRTLRRTQEAMEPSPASLGASAPSRPAGAPCSSPAGEVPSGASPVSQLALDIQVRRVA